MWEVQTKFWDGWQNCWTTEEKGRTIKVIFASQQEAEESLQEFLDDVKDAVACGDMLEEYDPADFRVVEL